MKCWIYSLSCVLPSVGFILDSKAFKAIEVLFLLVTALLVEAVPDILSGLLFLADVDWTRNCEE